MTVFKNGWQIEMKRLVSKIGLARVQKYEKIGSKVHPWSITKSTMKKILIGK